MFPRIGNDVSCALAAVQTARQAKSRDDYGTNEYQNINAPRRVAKSPTNINSSSSTTSRCEMHDTDGLSHELLTVEPWPEWTPMADRYLERLRRRSDVVALVSATVSSSSCYLPLNSHIALAEGCKNSGKAQGQSRSVDARHGEKSYGMGGSRRSAAKENTSLKPSKHGGPRLPKYKAKSPRETLVSRCTASEAPTFGCESDLNTSLNTSRCNSGLQASRACAAQELLHMSETYDDTMQRIQELEVATQELLFDEKQLDNRVGSAFGVVAPMNLWPTEEGSPRGATESLLRQLSIGSRTMGSSRDDSGNLFRCNSNGNPCVRLVGHGSASSSHSPPRRAIPRLDFGTMPQDSSHPDEVYNGNSQGFEQSEPKKQGTPMRTSALANLTSFTLPGSFPTASRGEQPMESFRKEDLARVAIRTFQSFDSGQHGCLPWGGGAIWEFVVSVFQQSGLPAPTESETYQTYINFDKDRRMVLDKQGCLSLVDALLASCIQSTAQTSSAQAAYPNDPHPTELAAQWVSEYVPLQTSGTVSISYSSGVLINFIDFAGTLRTLAELNAQHRLRMVHAIESGNLMRMALKVYRPLDRGGYLRWAGDEIVCFATNVFEKFGLSSLQHNHVFEIYACFDAEESGLLNASECLCVVDALVRSLVFLTSSSQQTLSGGDGRGDSPTITKCSVSGARRQSHASDENHELEGDSNFIPHYSPGRDENAKRATAASQAGGSNAPVIGNEELSVRLGSISLAEVHENYEDASPTVLELSVTNAEENILQDGFSELQSAADRLELLHEEVRSQAEQEIADVEPSVTRPRAANLVQTCSRSGEQHGTASVCIADDENPKTTTYGLKLSTQCEDSALKREIDAVRSAATEMVNEALAEFGKALTLANKEAHDAQSQNLSSTNTVEAIPTTTVQDCSPDSVSSSAQKHSEDDVRAQSIQSCLGPPSTPVRGGSDEEEARDDVSDISPLPLLSKRSAVSFIEDAETDDPLNMAQQWVAQYSPPPFASTEEITYSHSVRIIFADFREALSTVAAANASNQDAAVRAIDTGELMHRSLDTFKAVDKHCKGILSWSNGEIQRLVTSIFHQRDLSAPTESQVLLFFQKFDKDRTGYLAVLECLYLVDAIARAIFCVNVSPGSSGNQVDASFDMVLSSSTNHGVAGSSAQDKREAPSSEMAKATYMGNHDLDFRTFAKALEPLATANAKFHAKMIQALESGYLVQVALRAYQTIQSEKGVLRWSDGTIQEFVKNVFQDCGLRPPSDDETHAIYAAFDLQENATLKVRQCLVLVDALVRGACFWDGSKQASDHANLVVQPASSSHSEGVDSSTLQSDGIQKRAHMRTEKLREWVSTHKPFPIANITSILYLDRICIVFQPLLAYAHYTTPPTFASITRTKQAIESGAAMCEALQQYLKCSILDCDFLTARELPVLVAAVFESYGLESPNRDLFDVVFRLFDPERNCYLDAQECLCLVEALLRIVCLRHGSTEDKPSPEARPLEKRRKSAPRVSYSADDWVTTYTAPPMAKTKRMSYLGNVTITFADYAAPLTPAAALNLQHWAMAAEAVESGSLVRTALGVYKELDQEQRGYLSWEGDEIWKFVASSFESFGMSVPTKVQIYGLFKAFDTDERKRLDSSECLCLVDSIVRAMFVGRAPEVSREGADKTGLEASEDGSALQQSSDSIEKNAFAEAPTSAKASPPPVGIASIAYLDGTVEVEFARLAPILSSLLEDGIVDDSEKRTKVVKALENGSAATCAWHTFQCCDRKQKGSLDWHHNEIQGFITAIFCQNGLSPPSEEQMRHLCATFDTNESLCLSARACICMADAALRAALFAIDALETSSMRALEKMKSDDVIAEPQVKTNSDVYCDVIPHEETSNTIQTVNSSLKAFTHNPPPEEIVTVRKLTTKSSYKKLPEVSGLGIPSAALDEDGSACVTSSPAAVADPIANSNALPRFSSTSHHESDLLEFSDPTEPDQSSISLVTSPGTSLEHRTQLL